MKLRTLLAGLALGLSALTSTFAQPAAPSPVDADLKAIVGKIRAKIGTPGNNTAEALAPELAEFDALLAKYPEKNDSTAQVAMMKASLYLQIIRDEETGKRLLTALETDYPGTKAAAQAKAMLFQMTPEAKAKAKADADAREAKLAALVGQPAPELNFNWTSREGAYKKLSDLKGQVVVLDFWATWCGPCIGSFPQVREHVAHFKGAPVTFIGVTSLQGSVSNLSTGKVDTKGKPDLEYSLMPQFMKEKEMTWDVAFSAEQVFNPDYAIRGIPYVAIIAPDGTVRHAGLHPGAPQSDIAGKVEALLKEFKLPLPKAE